MVRRTRLNKGGRIAVSCVQKTPGGTAGTQPGECRWCEAGYSAAALLAAAPDAVAADAVAADAAAADAAVLVATVDVVAVVGGEKKI